MGQNEKITKQNTSIKVSTINGIIETLYLYTPTGENKVDFRGCSLDQNGKYVYDHKDMDTSPMGMPKEQSGFPKKDITPENITKVVTDFILKNNDTHKFEIKVDGKDVSYKDFCIALQKSEMILKTKGIAAAHKIESFGDIVIYTPEPGRWANQPLSEIEIFGTPATKDILSRIKELTKNGTIPITEDMVKEIDGLSETLTTINKTKMFKGTFGSVEVSMGEGESRIQIIQDGESYNPADHATKDGTNYTCFSFSLEDLKDETKLHEITSPAPTIKPKGSSKTR